jgi:hypothetical protein
MWFKALADTGCTSTSIHSSVATACGLQVISKGAAATPGGVHAINVYHGDIFVRSLISWTSTFEWTFPDRPLMEVIHQNPEFDILLGMDILNLGIFATNGGSKQAWTDGFAEGGGASAVAGL